jgi:hypothetical protein
LEDEDQGEAVSLDYQDLLSAHADEAGNLVFVTIRLPAATKLPEHTHAFIILDVFSISQELLPR